MMARVCWCCAIFWLALAVSYAPSEEIYPALIISQIWLSTGVIVLMVTRR